MPISHPDELSSTFDIPPFPIKPSKTKYDSEFVENLRMSFFNSLPADAKELHFGPIYRTRTSDGIPLTLFSCFTDSLPDPKVIVKGFKQRRRLLLLATTNDGEIEGFRSMAIDHYDRNGHDRVETLGHIATSSKGNRCLVPIELATRDMLVRIAYLEGTPIQQVVNNMNLSDLKDLIRPFVESSDLDKLNFEQVKKTVAAIEPGNPALPGIIAKIAEQERWVSAYKRLGFEPLAGEALYIDIDIPTDEKHTGNLLSVSEVDIQRIDTQDHRQISYSVLAQKNVDSAIVQEHRRNEYLENIKPKLADLCYPDD